MDSLLGSDFSDLPGRVLGKVKDRFNVCGTKSECLGINGSILNDKRIIEQIRLLVIILMSLVSVSRGESGMPL